MGLSYDCASSILLCSEDNNSILCFEEDENGEEEEEQANSWAPRHQKSGLYGDFLMGFLPLQSDECLELMVRREVEHMPRDDYAKRLITGGLDMAIRRDAIDWMWKVHHAYYNFSPLTAYLTVNYLDRFLSAYDLPKGLAWMTQLLAVACLSLAAKMEETDVPPCLDLQQVKVGESKHVFEPRAIQRMELLVLSTLKWRMQAVTPFSFIDYFLHKFNNGNPPKNSVFSQSAELILLTAKGIDFLVFRPSEIAAAVALSVLGETQLLQVAKAITCFKNVNKERVVRCYEVLKEVIIMNEHLKNASPSISSVMPESPNGVLDVACCLSYMSDDKMTVVEPHANSPDSKRRKMSKPALL